MSHELRTPLNAIIGVSEMLHEDAEEFDYREFTNPLQRIVRAGRDLLHLINEILDLSKIEAGKFDLQIESFGLDSAINDRDAVGRQERQQDYCPYRGEPRQHDE